MDTKRYLLTAAEVVACVEQSHGRKLTQQEINLSLEQPLAIGELLEPKERAFIDRIEQSEGRRLSLSAINRYLRRTRRHGVAF